MKRRNKLLLLLVLMVVFSAYYFIVGFSSNYSGGYFNKNENAIWLAHRWVGDEIDEKEIEALANDLSRRGFKTVFVHSGPINKDGTVPIERHPYGQRFVSLMSKYGPEIEVQAWLGQIRSKIDLDDAVVRGNLAEAARFMVEDLGFGGIHYDVEPVWDKDYGFIESLRLTRELLGEEVNISVALAELIPWQVIKLSGSKKDWVNYNTQYNYENVAQWADQIAVMVYDTSIESPWLYRLLVREQTIWLSKLLKGKELFVGIPTYDDNEPHSNPWVENIENGILGIVEGLNNIRSNKKTVKGVAIYANWTTEDDEWSIYESLWLN